MIVLLVLALVALAAVLTAWYRRDAARQKGRRTTLVALSVASRAIDLAHCPQEFLDRLAARMNLDPPT